VTNKTELKDRQQRHIINLKEGGIMGFWYILILFSGLFLVIKGLVGKKKVILILAGLLCVSFSIFMFTPGSDEIISNLLNLN